ncbi:MAG: hypothetical protein HC944_02020 [Nanoarchaeota archaeon]|nr:hypothetical protein [Nanoarchaeota archaeon]
MISLTFNELSFASHDSAESMEDIQAGCREGNILVFKFTNHEYLCTNPDTAKRWVELGLAEIIQTTTVATIDTPKVSEPVQNTTPIQTKIPTTTSENSQCREGYTLVFRFTHKDTFCTSPSTAASWVKLGLAEIIQKEIMPITKVESAKVIQEVNPKNNSKVNTSTPISTTKNIELPSFPKQPSINPKLLALNDYRYPPAIHKVNDRIWVAVGYDSANSVMIEGEKEL